MLYGPVALVLRLSVSDRKYEILVNMTRKRYSRGDVCIVLLHMIGISHFSFVVRDADAYDLTCRGVLEVRNVSLIAYYTSFNVISLAAHLFI